MPRFDFVSKYSTDCIYFRWQQVNYDENFDYDSWYTGGNRKYIPTCGNSLTRAMFWRPVEYPCEGCPEYESGEEQGENPPEE